MEQKEISLKELFHVIWKGKWIITISAAILMIIAGVGGMIYDRSTSSVTTLVTLQWNGLSQGEYPDGQRFEYNEAIEPYVISEAIIQSGLSIDTADVVNQLKVMPIIPSNSLAIIQTALEEGEQLSYYATNYQITINNGELDITVDEARDLMNNIIDEFRNDFERKFIQSTLILDYTDIDYTDVDYLDIYSILNAQTSVIESTMKTKMASNPGFTSTQLGIGFNQILVSVNLIKQIELDQISSRTNTYLLTKDEDYLITRYNYNIEVKTFEKETLELQETDLLFLENNYDGSKQTILIPGMNIDQEIEIDTYYNTLIQNIVNIQATISELEKDIEYLELQVLRLEGGDENFSVTLQEKQDNIAKVESAIISADSKLADVTDNANIILVEYNNYITSNIIKQLMTPQYEANISVLMISAIGLVFGAGVGAVVVLFRHEW